MPIVPLNFVGYETIPNDYPEMRKLLDAYNENFRWLEMLLNKGVLDKDNMSESFVATQNIANVFNFRLVGNYYTNMLGSGSLSSFLAQSNCLFAMPFPVPAEQNFDRIAINISSAVAGLCRLGVYADNGRVYPGALVSDAGEISTGITGLREIVIARTLNTGFYWLVCLLNAAPSMSGAPAGFAINLGHRAGAISGEAQGGWSVSSFTYGPLPGQFPAGAIGMSGVTPAVFLRKAA